MRKVRDEIYTTADALSRESPEAWLRFVAELRLYAGSVAMGILEATPQELPCAQGRGQEAHNILAMFETCRQRSEVAKQHNGPVTPSPLPNHSAGMKQKES